MQYIAQINNQSKRQDLLIERKIPRDSEL